MKDFRSHFVFNSQERNGIFLLVLIIVVLQVIFYFWSNRKTEAVDFFENEKEAAVFQQQIDSLKRIAAEENKPKIYPSNPNFLTDYKGYTLGMSTVEIDRLLKHRKEEKWVNSPEEFQQVTGVSDSLLEKLIPHFRFPAFKSQQTTNFSKTKKPVVSAERKDLNQATAEDLQQINGVGEVLAARIIKL